jgi:hypothetical protein
MRWRGWCRRPRGACRGRAVDDRRRLGGGVEAGNLLDPRGTQPQAVGHLLGRVLGRHLFEFLKADGVLTDKIGVIKIIADNLVDHGHGQEAVMTGLDLQPDVGLAGQRGPHRVDDDQCCPCSLAQ